MIMSGRSVLCGSAALAVTLAGGFGLRHATALTPADELASHRAVYELKLAQTRGNSPAMSARGRILYDFSGNACDGYALQFRQVSELDNGEGKVTLSDLRSTTWEDGAAKSYIFKSQNYLNETLIDTVDGAADQEPDKVVVKLMRPVDKTFDLESAMASAEVGTPVRLEFPVSGLPPIEARIDFVYPTLSERTRTDRKSVV